MSLFLSPTSKVSVFLGRYNQSGPNPNEVNRTAAQIMCHPDYNSVTTNNDICLLRLSAPVTYTDYIRPICLASANSTFYNGTSSWVTGWGTLSEGGKLRNSRKMTCAYSQSLLSAHHFNGTFSLQGSLANTLQEVNVPIVGNNRCRCQYSAEGIVINDNMLCAGLREGGKDSCQVCLSFVCCSCTFQIW